MWNNIFIFSLCLFSILSEKRLNYTFQRYIYRHIIVQLGILSHIKYYLYYICSFYVFYFKFNAYFKWHMYHLQNTTIKGSWEIVKAQLIYAPRSVFFHYVFYEICFFSLYCIYSVCPFGGQSRVARSSHLGSLRLRPFLRFQRWKRRSIFVWYSMCNKDRMML